MIRGILDPAASQVKIVLFRHAEAAWRDVLQPWLEASRGQLLRSYVVVATRAQAQGLKQRCLMENVPLMGVEFLTPGLARKKWLPLHVRESRSEARPTIGRELLLFGLETLIHRRLAPLTPEHPDWGFWKSLQSEPESALNDFDELLKAGFRAKDFELSPLQEIFSELTEWVEKIGYELGPLQSELAALTMLAPGAAKLGGRLLIYGLSAELWPEFSNVAALARRFQQVSAVLPDPEFRGQNALDENWIELWQSFLGVQAEPLEDAVSSGRNCEAVGLIWKSGQPGPRETGDERLPARVVVGKTRRDEMALVVEEVVALLGAGASQIGVVFSGAGAAHELLTEMLDRRGIQFHNTMDLAAAASLEVRIQRGIVAFYQQGSRLEDFLELWPLLRAGGHVSAELGLIRRLFERLFDERQTHALSAYAENIFALEKPDYEDLRRITRLLMPPLPQEATVADIVDRITVVCDALSLPMPANIRTLQNLGARDEGMFPTEVVLKAILALIPASVPKKVPEQAGFARVTLLTRRRAEGLTFSHLIFAESNAGVWPRRSEATPWLPDEYKTALNDSARFSLGIFTSDDRAHLEKQSYLALVRNTECEVIFSAALSEESSPDSGLSANSWVERVLWSDAELRASGCNLEQLFAALARNPESKHRDDEDVSEWKRVWIARRDDQCPFDEYFFSVDPHVLRPQAVAARVLERAVMDPAELWFHEVLAARRVEWAPLTRAKRKALGQWVHRVLAQALQPEAPRWSMGPRREKSEAEARLAAILAQWSALWPSNRYWESFALELARSAQQLLATLYELPTGDYSAAEYSLPAEASVSIGAGERLHVRGRIDYVCSDRPDWSGANVEIIDFKTGADAALSSQRMARDGFALQLGVYLAAAQSLGARAGRVWMLKPELNGFSSLDLSELPVALQPLEQIGRHLRSGVYGALTADASDYGPRGLQWPVACVPIASEILEAKFAKCFGELEEPT